MPITTDSRKDIVRRSFAAMAAGGVDEFAALTHPGFFNHEQADEPPETRGPDPEQALGVARWLRAAFTDLSWQEHAAVADGDLVVVHATMAGRHTGDFAGYDRDGRVAQAFAPTGRRFATTQSHWHRLRDGLIAEHWANRDDLGTAEQLGWVPPSPAYLLRCAAAKRRTRRAASPARAAEERPFGPWRGELDDAKEGALLALEAMRGGPLELFERAYHPDAYNREQHSEPPECRGRGPATFRATSRRLHAAFADLSWVVHHVASEGDLVAVHMTMSGRHVAPMAFYDADARVQNVFPPTGRSFAVTQTHWMRVAGDGRVIEHWANRDDLGMARQLGWVPPSPRMLARMALAKRRAR
jgi:predicted ester cyclase